MRGRQAYRPARSDLLRRGLMAIQQKMLAAERWFLSETHETACAISASFNTVRQFRNVLTVARVESK